MKTKRQSNSTPNELANKQQFKKVEIGNRDSPLGPIPARPAHAPPVFALKDPKIAGVYGRQKPLSYSSDFDKRDLFNLFGPEKKNTKERYFFS